MTTREAIVVAVVGLVFLFAVGGLGVLPQACHEALYHEERGDDSAPIRWMRQGVGILHGEARR